MADHYYSEKQTTSSNPQEIQVTLKDYDFKFTTDSGVFSKQRVDFGSKLLIETFEEPNLSGDLLDVGCGYGPIGLSFAKAYQNRTVHLVDVNERALTLAKENAEKNKIENVEIYKSDRLSEVQTKQVAAVISNPPIRAGKKIILAIYSEAHDLLQQGGELWLVIQKKQGAPSTIKFLQNLYSAVDVVKKQKGYYIIKAKK